MQLHGFDDLVVEAMFYGLYVHFLAWINVQRFNWPTVPPNLGRHPNNIYKRSSPANKSSTHKALFSLAPNMT